MFGDRVVNVSTLCAVDNIKPRLLGPRALFTWCTDNIINALDTTIRAFRFSGHLYSSKYRVVHVVAWYLVVYMADNFRWDTRHGYVFGDV